MIQALGHEAGEPGRGDGLAEGSASGKGPDRYPETQKTQQEDHDLKISVGPPPLGSSQQVMNGKGNVVAANPHRPTVS